MVVEGLDKLASGATYADVGKWAYRRTNTPPPKSRKKSSSGGVAAGAGASESKGEPSSKSSGGRRGNQTWHVGADWVEAGSPPLYNHLDQRLRAAAIKERRRLDCISAAGEPLDRPQVILADEVPITGVRSDPNVLLRQDEGFYVLVIAEQTPAGARLRLARAMPTSSTAAWALVLDELGYTPDVVVADGASAIFKASEHVIPTANVVTCVYHLASAIEDAYLRKEKLRAVDPGAAKKRLHPKLRNRMSELGRNGTITNLDAWGDWWDRLAITAAELDLNPAIGKTLRRYHEPRLTKESIELLHAYPADVLPWSIGGLESILRTKIKPLFSANRKSFSNLERTNRLVDLVVCKAHNMFDDHGAIAEILRDDVASHHGWRTVTRDLDDRQPQKRASESGQQLKQPRYKSLTDTFLIERIAIEKRLIK